MCKFHYISIGGVECNTLIADYHVCLQVCLSIFFRYLVGQHSLTLFEVKCGQEASFDLVNYEENYGNYEEKNQMSLPRRGFKSQCEFCFPAVVTTETDIVEGPLSIQLPCD